MDGNDEQQIINYHEAQRLLTEAKRLTMEIDIKKISGSQVEPVHLRITHLEQQAICHALLAGIRLPERTEEA